MSSTPAIAWRRALFAVAMFDGAESEFWLFAPRIRHVAVYFRRPGAAWSPKGETACFKPNRAKKNSPTASAAADGKISSKSKTLYKIWSRFKGRRTPKSLYLDVGPAP
mmetsp:Transcript_24044/g.72422  ORF Transcript_24044/g.72422 Transcript_24044/m.72422 type:complete len:108 (+) Transcript_24044:1431-1754(+)